MPEIKVRVPPGSEVSTDMDLGVFRRLDQPGPVLLRKLSSFCGKPDFGPSGLSCVSQGLGKGIKMENTGSDMNCSPL